MTKKFKSLLIALLGLSSVIVVHELGHFIFCMLFGVKVPVFSVGFGPRLIGYKIGGTLFQIALLPLGGYNAINEASFAAQPYLHKLIIDFAGIAFNIICALVLFIVIALRTNNRKTIPIIAEIIPNSPASNSDLQVDDTIVKFDGITIGDNLQDLMQKIGQLPNRPITLTVERNGQPHDIHITLGNLHPLFGAGVGWLGARFKTIKTGGIHILSAIAQGAYITYTYTINVARILFGMFKPKKRADLTGPIGIISSSNTSQVMGSIFFLLWLAIININVAIFNLLPVPFFDGGHILFNTIEAIIGQPIPPTLIQFINSIFLLLFLFLLIWVSARDVKKMQKR